MEARSNQTTSFYHRMGVLIPSPLISHTHAAVLHPFDTTSLLTVKDRLMYLPEHAISSYPLEHQAIQHAGQLIVVREMAKLRKAEVQARRTQSLPQLILNIHRNPKVKPLSDLNYWRKTLGWAGSEDNNEGEQCNRYSALLPGKSRLLKGVYEKYVWDHDVGEWNRTTLSNVDEATERQNWVCDELERIDALRYEVMAEWNMNIQAKCMAKANKRKRADETPITETSSITQQEDDNDKANAATPDLARRKTVSFDDSAELSSAKRPRPSIEPPFELIPPENPDSQTTRSSFSAFSTSPDANHEVRSQAPEPESPTKEDIPYSKETAAHHLRRYSFVLDIPTTDGQRVEWIKFLDKYQWNHAMISALRKFFMAEPTPNMDQTAAFLIKLKAVCATVEVINSHNHERSYRLLWDEKIVVKVAEAAVETVHSPSPSSLARNAPQQTWLTTSRVSRNPDTRTPKAPSPSNLTISPTSSQVREVAAAVNIQSAMKKFVATLRKGDRVEPPCDRCRELSLECRINKTSCKGCADSHNRCMWSVGLEGGGDAGHEKSPIPAPRGLRKMKGSVSEAVRAEHKKRARRGGKRGVVGGGSIATGKGKAGPKKRSIYVFPENGEEYTGGAVSTGNDVVESTEDEGDEWVPSS